MTPLQRHHGIFFLVLRRLRAPLIVLITILAVSVLGLTLAPGLDGAGRLSFFHAFYFISYTATTIGFGEIPVEFSNQQRMWVTICIYLSVIGWAYTLGTVFTLLADRNLHLAIRTQRFARAVRRLREPFYLVCGYGETGRLICSALDRMGVRAVVVELDDAKVGELDLHGYTADVPALAADAGNPETLSFAGLTSPHCAGVIALTDDDSANLAIAITARLLAPRLPALCRAESPETAANMASFGTRHIINPFEKFSEYMALAVQSPAAWQLLAWLTSLPGSTVEHHRDPPRGHWILCGHGRFGKAMLSTLSRESMPVTVIDRQPPGDAPHRWVQGDGTGAEALLAADVRQAVGLIAATSSDVDNLSAAVTARGLNPGLFVVLRQNHYSNHALFDAFDADFNMVPSEIIAHECLAVLSTPLLAPFLREMKARDEEWRVWLLKRLTGRFGWEAPTVWSERINIARAPALHRRLMAGEEVGLDTLLRSPQKRAEYLPCEVLYIQRDDSDHLVMPLGDTLVRPGDELLLAGRRRARGALGLSLANEQALAYLLSGVDLPGGWIWERLARRKQIRKERRLPG
ncbi:potassium channel protein [Pseudothauera nasutitermitis]|uniref:Potassium channel protein n=1 Tax=Pseudothauera nasutitermitis TaxID=2565930 RepID=A0A4S4B1R2_9RHOO|nr:potassium channel protein [Pseudothauera nasutitermitis]THF66466.1 potassium channel protein [Pseudothauera nasutitermitis]